jgi:hypothetical protein
LKKKTSSKALPNLDKHLFEAGQQCQKRLWLDAHEPANEEPTGSRREMSAVGEQLRALARSVFPKGVLVETQDAERAAEETKKLLAEGTPVLFGATFVADGVEARSDILVQHKDGAVDLYEIKSGIKIKHRYVNDLALQAHVAERCGLRMRAAFLLHLNPKYVHKEGADFPPMQLLRSADITSKVQKQVELVRRRLQQFRQNVNDKAMLLLPMGTYCTAPFPCPHLARCASEAPALPLRELPELTRAQELELHKEGVEELTALDPKRPGLTFRQRRTLACLQQDEPILEPFVREELRQCHKPLHFLAIAAVTDALPRFEGQRPWRQLPYAWAANTLHPDGRLETASFVHVDRTDPRTAFISSLAKQLEVGGTILCWNDDALNELRALLDDLPAAKVAVRAVLGRPHLDMMQLFDSGVFHKQVRTHADLRQSVAALLDDPSGAELSLHGEDELREALAKAQTPRIRSTTRDRIAAEIQASVAWASDRLLQLYRKFAEVEAPGGKPRAAAARTAQKALPKPLPEPG